MKKKNKVIIVCLLLFCTYFGFKGFNLYYYNINNITTVNYRKIVEALNIKETINIEHKKLPNNEYLEFKNIKIKNDFKEFKRSENQYSKDTIKYVLYDEKGKVKASFWMSEADTYIELLKSDKTLFGTGDNKITNDNLKDIIDENNITNDIELFNYLSKNKDVKNNIFTSVKQMKKNYSLQFMVSVTIPVIENITLIDGDYQGYIFNMDKIKEVNILKNNKRYVFTFLDKSYFTDEKINNLIETIVIN